MIPLAFLLWGIGTAFAENWHAYRPERRPMPPSQAMSIAQKQQEGRILSAQLVKTGEGHGYYRIKVISDGKIRILTVDAYPGN